MDYNVIYNQWLTNKPYSWSQAEKEAHYLPYFKALTYHHEVACPSYGQALQGLNYHEEDVRSMADIPMLPISLFKLMDLKSIPDDEVFKTLVSSGTTGQAVSHIYLDAATAQNQQLTLYSIMTDFFGAHRLPMLIVDVPSVLRDRVQFNARGAAILGFSLLAKRKYYALHDDMTLDTEAIEKFLQKCDGKAGIIFGFTFMIWKYLYQACRDQGISFDFSQMSVLHGGGWKKLQAQAVSNEQYKAALKEQFQIPHVYNYYGMSEQTGCIYMECPCGHLHASIFSDIIIRDPKDFSPCPVGKKGIVQVQSPMAYSYPGHSILTEDMGTLLGVDDCPCGRKGKYFRIDGRIPKAEIRGCSDTHG